MRIVHVTQPVDAGVAAVVLALASDQLARGWAVTIACPPSGALVDQARARGIDVREWRASRGPGPSTVGEAERLRSLVREIGPDVVHLHSSKAGLAGRLALRGEIPTIFQPHMWSFQSVGGPVRALTRLWERFAARWTDHLVCVSEDEDRDGRGAGIDMPTEVVRNGVDTDAFRPTGRTAARRALGLPEGGKLAVCVGRLAPLKGQDLLLDAWPAVLDSVPGARLLFVGDGPLAEEYRAHPNARHGSVRWWGPTTATAPFYAAADVVVVPSRAEGMALVPLEAMASGRPVVAFDVGGVHESVGDAGAVLPPGDVAGLASAVVARFTDLELASAEAARGRRRAVDLFDQSRMADQLATLAEKVAAK